LKKVWMVIALLPACIFAQPAEWVLYMIGNAHIDLAYRWRWNETTDRVTPDTFIGVLDMLDKMPELTFAQSQVALYESIEKTHPQVFRRIREKINAGQWSVVGGQWAEPDAILPSGESHIRQFLIGMEYCRTHLGVDSIHIGWLPDAFCGQALTLPQIFSGCGIRYYLFGRGAPAGKEVFRWIAPDSSSMLAYHLPVPYGLTAPDADLLTPLRDWRRTTGLPFAMVLFGEGDHGGGPRQTDIEAIERLRKMDGVPTLRFATAEDFFARLAKAPTPWPAHFGEIGRGIGESDEVDQAWMGSYTSQAVIKKMHRNAENLLLTAEKFATIGSMLQRKPLFPRVDFREAWKLLLRNQFHDILPGTSIGDVFDDSRRDLQWVDQEGHRLLRFGLEVIGSRIDTRDAGIPLVVYNPCSWVRGDVVEADVHFVQPCEQFTVLDTDTEPIAYQVLSVSEDKQHYRLLMAVHDIPSIGYKVYRVVPHHRSLPKTELFVKGQTVESRYFRISWNQTGLSSIYDKTLNREVLSGSANRLQLLGESRSSAWDLVLSGEEFPLQAIGRPVVVERGPVRVVVRWQNITSSSRVVRDLILHVDQPRIDFAMTVDWHESDRMLKAVFPVSVSGGRAVFEQPYGVIERPLDGMDHPAQNWIDFSESTYGVALLNDGKYGFDVKDQTMRMSIVRASRDMDPRMDEGTHTFHYALFPHAGDWVEGRVMQAALQLNQPLVSLQENHHIGSLPDWGEHRNDFSLARRHSFFAVDQDQVIITAVKVQQGDWSPNNVVLRLFEPAGRNVQARVFCPARPKRVVAANHLEDPIPGAAAIQIERDGFLIPMKANEIRTLLLEF